MSVILKIPGPDLSSRRSAAKFREDILSHITKGNGVVLDLSGVLSISEAYADELLGVPAGLYGLQWLRENVQVQVGNDRILRTIATAVKRRLLVGRFPVEVR